MTDPLVSIVIVNWNAHLLLRACLQSIDAALAPDAEAIVVDNGSTDGSSAMVKLEFPSAVLVEAGRNAGFAEGCNLGISAARGRWIATLNNDAVAAPGWLDALRAAARGAPPRLGMIQCRMLFAHDPSLVNSTGVCLFDDGRAEDRDYGRPAASVSAGAEIFCPTAGAALYRRAMLDEVRLPSGWFDRTFFLYNEDVDLGWRCRLAGWDARYQPDATVLHDAHATSGRRGWRFVKSQCASNRIRTILKNASTGFITRTLGRTAFDLLRIPAMGGGRALGNTLGGIRGAIRERGEVSRLVRVPREEIERTWAIGRGADGRDADGRPHRPPLR